MIRTYAVEIQTDDKRDLEENRVMTLVRKAMGANCKSVVDGMVGVLLMMI